VRESDTEIALLFVHFNGKSSFGLTTLG